MNDISVTEHADRMNRVQSVRCPHCKAGKGRPCTSPGGQTSAQTHSKRWATYYKAARLLGALS